MAFSAATSCWWIGFSAQTPSWCSAAGTGAGLAGGVAGGVFLRSGCGAVGRGIVRARGRADSDESGDNKADESFHFPSGFVEPQHGTPRLLLVRVRAISKFHDRRNRAAPVPAGRRAEGGVNYQTYDQEF